MKYFAALAALVAAVQAASLGNTNYDTIAAGQSFTITWYDASGSVTVDLRNGLSTDLKQLQTIVGEFSFLFFFLPKRVTCCISHYNQNGQ